MKINGTALKQQLQLVDINGILFKKFRIIRLKGSSCLLGDKVNILVLGPGFIVAVIQSSETFNAMNIFLIILSSQTG
jgi:hypothetical protein